MLTQPYDGAPGFHHPDVRASNTWTVRQHDGRNHHELWCNALPGQQMALITSVCAPCRCGPPASRTRTQGEPQSLMAVSAVTQQDPSAVCPSTSESTPPDKPTNPPVSNPVCPRSIPPGAARQPQAAHCAAATPPARTQRPRCPPNPPRLLDPRRATWLTPRCAPRPVSSAVTLESNVRPPPGLGRSATWVDRDSTTRPGYRPAAAGTAISRQSAGLFPVCTLSMALKRRGRGREIDRRERSRDRR